MRQTLMLLLVLLSLVLPSSGVDLSVPVWTDSEKAAAEVEGFPLVGEYLSRSGPSALQVTLLKDGDFLVAIYRGGLPGNGWDGSRIESRKLNSEALKAILEGYTKTDRESPTLEMPAPDEAILVFPDDFTNVENGLLHAGGRSIREVGSFHLHIEFMLPFKPGRDPSSQDRGNSGIYIFNNYEVQVIDSFGLDLEEENNAIGIESESNRWCGALYKTKAPDVNMALSPLRWQTYDIDFEAPQFDGDRKTRNARITVEHNGVRVHDGVELKDGTGLGATREQCAEGRIYFQDHGNPVVFRNVWATALESSAASNP